LNPDSAECHFNIASAYNDKGDYENAIKHYKDSLRYDPNNAETFVNLGTIYEIQKKLTESLEAFQHALKINPDSQKAQEGEGRVSKMIDEGTA